MTLISKAAGGLSLASCVHDIHKTALIYSKNEYAKASANSVISNSVSNQKANSISYKDTQRKNWLAKNNFFASIKEGFASVVGYVKGIGKASVRYIPNFILASLALFMGKKHDKIANIATVGLGIVEAIDFLKNSVGIGQRDDYLNIR